MWTRICFHANERISRRKCILNSRDMKEISFYQSLINATGISTILREDPKALCFTLHVPTEIYPFIWARMDKYTSEPRVKEMREHILHSSMKNDASYLTLRFKEWVFLEQSVTEYVLQFTMRYKGSLSKTPWRIMRDNVSHSKMRNERECISVQAEE